MISKLISRIYFKAMSESDESTQSDSSTCISIRNRFSFDFINEKLIQKICLLLEALINFNKKKSLKKKIYKRTSFDLKRIPFISLYDYIYRIIKYTHIDDNTLIKALIYLDLFNRNNKYIISYFNIHKLIFVAIVLSVKYSETGFLTNKSYAKIGGISINELYNLEIKFCRYINYRLYINKELFEKYSKHIYNDYIFVSTREKLRTR